MSTWREEKRADRVAEARIQMEQEAAETQRRISERSAAAQQRRADKQAAVERFIAETEARRARRAAQRKQQREWATEHAVDLLIYPLALVSAVLAVPAMADYGYQVYGGATGYVLPALSELGMWAFALAVQVSRRRTPDRSVWALQLGVWLFAAVNVALNALHGAQTRIDYAVVMGVCSVAGVIAHQLITAGRRRSQVEKSDARHGRSTLRKVDRVRRVALRTAVGDVDPDGNVSLVYIPGQYRLTRFGRGVDRAIVPGMPVDSEATDWDAELADLAASGTTDKTTEQGGSTPDRGGSISTIDRDADQRESSPKAPRSLAQLKAEFWAEIAADRVDPTVVESIRKALHCSPRNARKLRDYYLATKDHKGGQK